MDLNSNGFFHVLKDMPIINCHSHFLPSQACSSLTLEGVLRNSYVSWCGAPLPSGNSKDAISRWLVAVRSRSYFVWLEKSLMELYDIDTPLEASTWEIYDSAIQRARRDKHWDLHILQDKCRYRSVLLDAYWSPGESGGYPPIFRTAYRVNSFFYGFNLDVRDHNGNNIQIKHGRCISNIDEYMEFIYEVTVSEIKAGAAVLKCALAYDRTLDFGLASRKQAERAFQADPEPGDVKAFQDYIFDWICTVAAELNIPIQIHTGLAGMKGSNAMQLHPMISRHPKTKFLLMHGGYPWLDDVLGLAHTYPNVWVDLSWLPLISWTAAYRFLHELIDVCDADRIVWGCDTWTSEESFGARKAFCTMLGVVLNERITMGLLRGPDAQRLAGQLMYENASRLLKSDG